MTSLDIRRETARKLDAEKLQLEASVVTKVKSTFKNMANDAQALYLTTGSIPSQELANNYYPEFLKEVRDAFRKSIKRFGFNLRGSVEKKYNLFFDAEYKKQFIDFERKESIQIIDENLDPKLERINNQFAVASSVFIANQSEEATNFITNTNAKEIELAVQQEEIFFANAVAEQSAQIGVLTTLKLNSNNPAKVQRKIDAARRKLDEMQDSARNIVASNINKNLVTRSQARSELIASQNIGLAESWSRQTEAELISDSNLESAAGAVILVKKSWDAILDSKTRSSHAAAEITNVNIPVGQPFVVGGEQLRYPRDPLGSAGNIINCRCNSSFSV